MGVQAEERSVQRIGYLIPEFPGQTHIFFWREAQALAERGIEVRWVSTRRPPRGIMSHTWAAVAERATLYLMPMDAGAMLRAIGQVLSAGPRGWWRCIRTIAAARDAGWKGRLRLAALALAGARLAGVARREGWRHVHVHSAADSANVALMASMLCGLTYSLTLHGLLEHYGANQRQKWRNARFGVAITQTLAQQLRRRLGDDLPARLEVASMGVEVQKFQRSRAYRPWTGDGPARIISTGRLNEGKGHQDVIEAIAILRREGLDVRLRIAGEDEQGGGGYHRELERLIRQRSLDDAVTLMGAVSEEAVLAELEWAHVFALGSHDEAIGVAIMEAMAMELPVVVTRVGGVCELVEDGADGIFVKPSDPPEMARAIRRVLEDRELAESLGKRARRKIERSFHSGVSAEAIARNVPGRDRARPPGEVVAGPPERTA